MAIEQAVLPDRVSSTPGPELAAALERLDLTQVPDGQIVEVLQAVSRQIAHLHGLYYETMVEVGRREPPPDRPHGLSPEMAAERRAWQPLASWHWATDQIGAALTFSRRRTDIEYGLARQLVDEIPLVWQALAVGDLDLAKARVFAGYLADLTGEQVELICGRLLPYAPGWTTGQLAHRLLREILAVDPHYTRRRYEKAIRERGVWGYLADDGTAVLTAAGLNPTEAAAAAERLEQLAAAVRAAGHPATEQQLRADLFVRLLDGRYAGLTSEEIAAALLAEVGGNPEDRDADDRDPENRDPDPADCEPVDLDAAMAGPAAPSSAAPSHPVPSDPAGTGAAPVPPERVGIEVRVGLATLLGIDDHPAELPGWGPITAEDARLLVGRQRAAEWRFAVVDQQGYLVFGGLLRGRPAGPGCGAACRGGVVEINVRDELLTDLAGRDTLPPGWAAVVADIAGQYTDRDAALTALDALDADPTARFPGAGLRRHVQLRDRSCVAPGCRRAARKTELDHTHDHAHGGSTVRGNLDPLCVPHHRMKHCGGWTLTQDEPGRFCWCSPLGQFYYTRGEPIAPDLPEPVPGPTERPDDTGEQPRREVGPIFDPSEWAKLIPPEPPEHRHGDDPPPF